MMTSMLTMTSGRSSSQRRMTNLAASNKSSISTGYSGSPILTVSDLDLDPSIKQEQRKSDGDENNSNNRSASEYLSKLLNSRDLSNDFDGSPATFANSDSNSFAYIPMKSTAASNTRSTTMQKGGTTQKKNSRSSHSHRHERTAEYFELLMIYSNLYSSELLYRRCSSHIPVFRKDLISAMKLPDNSQLLHEEYWVMQDSWKIEWEKGVQVPVNQKAIPMKNIRTVTKEMNGGFRMPRKMVKCSPEPGDKDMVDLNVLADSTCRYDLDNLDVLWLNEINRERRLMALKPLDEFSMERIMEELEIQCHDNMQQAIKTKKGLGIEYDENIVCDVCQMLNCEEGNEMVFCDGCNLCVHQACYGILKVPDGNWLCRPCALGVRGSAVCILCDKKGGAMKSTRSGNKWAHVSCALWIPEISIADPERMEPITKVSHVPASRWTLLCSICKNRSGACIQCSVKHCVTAYHVTCAIESKLDMNADYGSDDDDDEPVVFRSYCKKHSTKRKGSDAEEEQSEEEKRSQRQRRIMELEEEFFTFVKPQAVASVLSIPCEIAEQVLVFWKLKRKANFNRPLITPKNEEDTALAEAAETNLQKRLRMFTHLRQDLERVRNLCYMIGRREKTKRATVKNMESVFLTQMKVLERRMCEETQYDSSRMVPFLKSFGKPEVCELARKESLLLAKSAKWSQTMDDSDSNRTDSPAQTGDVEVETRKRLPSSEDNKMADDCAPNTDKVKSRLAGDKLKNGLHRKAFESACQKRQSLVKRDRQKAVNNDGDSASKVVAVNQSPLKRSRDSDSDSDVLDPTVGRTASKRNRLSKAHSWISWRTSNAAASPSSYTVKTSETSSVRDTVVGAESSSAAKSRSRSISALSDASAKSKDSARERLSRDPIIPDLSRDPIIADQALPSRTESHLVVKWDSDNNPDITEKSTVPINRKHSLHEEKVHSISKPVVRSDSTRLNEASRRRVQLSSTDSKLKPHNREKEPSQGRLSLSTAKNDSGALVLSCDNIDKDAPSPEQELRHRATASASPGHWNDIDRRSSRKLNRLSKHPAVRRKGGSERKREDDGGYGGDLESDSDTVSPIRHKALHSHHRPSLKGASLAKSTDSSTSCNADQPKRPVNKKRRIKVARSRPDAAPLVSFQGFKDLDDGARKTVKSPSPENVPSPLAEPSSPTILKPIDDVKTEAVCDSADKNTDHQAMPEATDTTGNAAGNEDALDPLGLLSNNDTANEIPSETPVCAQDYQSALYSILASNPMLNMSYFSQQALYYSSHFSYPLWPPPPPPPPPPDDEEEPPSTSHTMPVEMTPPPPLSGPEPSSLTAPCNHDEDASQVPLSVSHDSMQPSTNEAPQVPLPAHTSSIATNVQSLVDPSTDKKKKKKKKSKKKKKKRKRKHSRAEHDLSFSNASSDYGEFCVAYCSTLADDRPPDPESPSLPPEPPAASPRPETSATMSSVVANNLEADAPTANVNSSTVENREDAPLVVKIDKNKMAANSQNSSDSCSDFSDVNEPPTIEESPSEKPLVMPLKLKLCGQKSDRTLRGGLIAREYQILDSGSPPTLESKLSPVPQDPPVASTSSSKPPSKSRSEKSKSKKAARKSSKPSSQSKSTGEKSSSLVASTSATPSAARTSTLLEKSVSSAQNLPGDSNSTKSIVSSVPLPRSSLHSEQHWKKRKLHVHEASVTTDQKLNALPKIGKEIPPNSQSYSRSSSNIPQITTTDIGDNKSNCPTTTTSVIANGTLSTPSVKAQPKQRRKKATASGKAEQNSTRFAQSGLPPVLPYKFEVSNTHQKKMASASSVEDKTSRLVPVKEQRIEGLNVGGQPGDPYDFPDFGET